MATNLLNINNITPKTSSFDVSWSGAASLDNRYSHSAGNGATPAPHPTNNQFGTGASFKYNTRRIDVTHREYLGPSPSFSVYDGLVVGRTYTVVDPIGSNYTGWYASPSLIIALKNWYTAVGAAPTSTYFGGITNAWIYAPPANATFVATSNTPPPAGLGVNTPQFAQTNNVVTLTTSSPHGLNAGDKVYLELYETSSSGYGFSNNTFYTLVDSNLFGIAPSSTTISFFATTSATTYAKTPVNASLFASTTDNIFRFTGDYTIEGFTVLQAFGSGNIGVIWTPRWLFRATDGTNSFGVRVTGGANTAEVFTNSNSASRSATLVGPGQSFHFALVRKGSIVSFLANGHLVMSFTSSGTHGYSSAFCSTDDGLIISNFRVTDRALYDPINMSIPVGQGSILSYDLFPKGPLTAVAGTRLLTFQDPTLKDNSGNNHVVSCVNRNSITSGGGSTLNSTTTLTTLTPFSRIGGIQWTDVRQLPGTRQSILTNPVGSNKNIKINSLRIFARTNTNGYQGYYGWEIGVIDADSKVNIIAGSQFLKSTMNDGSEFASTKHFIGDVIDSPIYLSPGTTLFGAVHLETYFTGTIAYEEIS